MSIFKRDRYINIEDILSTARDNQKLILDSIEKMDELGAVGMGYEEVVTFLSRELEEIIEEDFEEENNSTLSIIHDIANFVFCRSVIHMLREYCCSHMVYGELVCNFDWEDSPHLRHSEYYENESEEYEHDEEFYKYLKNEKSKDEKNKVGYEKVIEEYKERLLDYIYEYSKFVTDDINDTMSIEDFGEGMYQNVFDEMISRSFE